MISNRVWIEIESPYYDGGKLIKGRTSEEAAKIADARASLVSNMLRRMGILSHYKGEIVWWDKSEKRRGYMWTISEAGEYYNASDNGQWYNLDWLGRDPGE